MTVALSSDGAVQGQLQFTAALVASAQPGLEAFWQSPNNMMAFSLIKGESADSHHRLQHSTPYVLHLWWLALPCPCLP